MLRDAPCPLAHEGDGVAVRARRAGFELQILDAFAARTLILFTRHLELSAAQCMTCAQRSEPRVTQRGQSHCNAQYNLRSRSVQRPSRPGRASVALARHGHGAGASVAVMHVQHRCLIHLSLALSWVNVWQFPLDRALCCDVTDVMIDFLTRRHSIDHWLQKDRFPRRRLESWLPHIAM